MRKISVPAGAIAVAAAGSMLLGGVALAADCDGPGGGSGGNQGGNGTGGKATNNCLNVGVPILSGIGVAGQGQVSGASCDASANGHGGSAY